MADMYSSILSEFYYERRNLPADTRLVPVVNMAAMAELDRRSPSFLCEGDVTDFTWLVPEEEAGKLLRNAVRDGGRDNSFGLVLARTYDEEGAVFAQERSAMLTCAAAFFSAYSKGCCCSKVVGLSVDEDGCLAGNRGMAGVSISRLLSSEATNILYDEMGISGHKPVISIDELSCAETATVPLYSGSDIPLEMAEQILYGYYVDAVTECVRTLSMRRVPGDFSTIERIVSFGAIENRATGYNVKLQQETNELYSIFCQVVSIEGLALSEMPLGLREIVSDIAKLVQLRSVWQFLLDRAAKAPSQDGRSSLLNVARAETKCIKGLSEQAMEIGRLLGIDSAVVALFDGVPVEDIVG